MSTDKTDVEETEVDETEEDETPETDEDATEASDTEGEEDSEEEYTPEEERDYYKAQLNKKNNEARNLRKRLKDAEAKLKETPESDKNSSKAKKESGDTDRLSALERENWRLTVALELGLDPGLKSRING